MSIGIRFKGMGRTGLWVHADRVQDIGAGILGTWECVKNEDGLNPIQN